MVREYKSVQSRILNQNSRTLFMPCKIIDLIWFSEIQLKVLLELCIFLVLLKDYTLFSTSMGRWNIFSKQCRKWTVKKWSETRWENRYDSINAIKFQVKEIIDVFDEISETTRGSTC